MYLLGRSIRKLYIKDDDIRWGKYDDNLIIVKAAPEEASIDSANAHLMGMFPPGVGEPLPEID